MRPCRSIPGSAQLNDESDKYDVSEVRPTDVQHPDDNARYIAKPRESDEPTDVSLDSTVAAKSTVAAYKKLWEQLLRCTVSYDIEGEDLFVLDDFKSGSCIM